MELGGLALEQRSARVPRPLGSAQASVEADRRLIEGPRASTAELASRTADKAFATRFKRGQSGNPSGQSRLYHECRKLVRHASPEMMKELIELARTAADERVRAVCVIACLDRGGVAPISLEQQSSQSRDGAAD